MIIVTWSEGREGLRVSTIAKSKSQEYFRVNSAQDAVITWNQKKDFVSNVKRRVGKCLSSHFLDVN